MNIKKSLQLTTKPLEKLLHDGEVIDFRLDELDWKDLSIGDYIEFWEDFTGHQREPSQNSRTIVVKILSIYRAPTFPELFTAIEQSLGDSKDHERLLAELRIWWSEKEETSTGVLAFYVHVSSPANTYIKDSEKPL